MLLVLACAVAVCAGAVYADAILYVCSPYAVAVAPAYNGHRGKCLKLYIKSLKPTLIALTL